MIKTAEQLKQQAILKNIAFWHYHTCSMCGYHCGFYFENNHSDVYYDCGCNCVSYNDTRKEDWNDVARCYNMNQPENNQDISKDYLRRLNDVWKFDDVEKLLNENQPSE